MINKKYIIQQTYSARKALGQLNDLGSNDAVLFVLNESNQVIGTLTDGDIRRGFLHDLKIDESVEKFMNKEFHFFNEDTYDRKNLAVYKNLNLSYVPLLNKERELLKIVEVKNVKALLPVDAVIMAGGRGERLRPLTDKTPKPLLNVGNKPIIEHNIDRLSSYGIKNFHVTLRYLSEQIKSHLGNGNEKDIEINYIIEKEPLGTVGAASLITNFKHNDILLINSDLLTNIDYEELYNVYDSCDADMVVATVPYEVAIPYAVMDIDNSNSILGFKEKPKYVYYSNAGIYLFNKQLLKHLPYNQRYDMTEFMESLLEKKYRIVSFPIMGYWLDIGRMEDYRRAQQEIYNIKL